MDAPFDALTTDYSKLHQRASCFVSIGVKILLTSTSLGHAFRRQTAGAFGPDLAKKLSQLVKMEKNVMRSMELVGRERMEVAVSRISSNLSAWSFNTETDGVIATTLDLG